MFLLWQELFVLSYCLLPVIAYVVGDILHVMLLRVHVVRWEYVQPKYYVL